jgi:hypothetical protein
MRSFIIAAVAALTFAGATEALAMGGGGGAGKSPVVASGTRRDSASPLLYDRQHAAQRHCKTNKPCPRK